MCSLSFVSWAYGPTFDRSFPMRF
uniref:Uncharacterized protein n=1 Tax=Anguilla anguilla TaxID=7936 RepID=A0A0E9V7H6_ANGAN